MLVADVADSYITVTPKLEYISKDDKTISEQQQYWKFINNFFVSQGGIMSDSHNTLPDMVPVSVALSNTLDNIDMQLDNTLDNRYAKLHIQTQSLKSTRFVPIKNPTEERRRRRVKQLKCQLYPTFKMHWLSLNLTLGTLLVPKGTLW